MCLPWVENNGLALLPEQSIAFNLIGGDPGWYFEEIAISDDCEGPILQSTSILSSEGSAEGVLWGEESPLDCHYQDGVIEVYQESVMFFSW